MVPRSVFDAMVIAPAPIVPESAWGASEHKGGVSHMYSSNSNQNDKQCMQNFEPHPCVLSPLTAVSFRVTLYGKEAMMTEMTKLTVRVPRYLLEEAKRYAKIHDTTLTRLIAGQLQQLAAERDWLADAPIVRRLSGSLSPTVKQEDYREYLEQKYGQG